MSKKIPVGVFVFVLIAAVLATFMTTYVLVNDVPTVPIKSSSSVYTEEQQKLIDKLVRIDNLYNANYIGELDYDNILDGILYGYTAGSGDRYSQYLNVEEYATYSDSTVEGTMVGIGVNVVYDTIGGLIEIVNITRNSPAAESDLRIGDLINTVEGKSVVEIGYTNAVDLMLGEEGTNANFTVLRGEDRSEEVSFSITRRKIEQQSVFYHIYENDPTIGIIRIDNFNGKVESQYKTAISELMSLGAEKFVFDVRNNPGGELMNICNILDTLLPDGPIIRSVDKNGIETQVIFSDSEYIDVPIAVLVNESTASAAELFACALQDYAKNGRLNNVTLIGTTTFGKGTMQTIFNLNDGTGLRMSVATYNPPYSDNYDGIGVVPDITEELDESLQNKNFFKISDEEDNQLQTAISVLKNN